MTCIIRACHATHTLVMLTGKHTIPVKHAIIFNHENTLFFSFNLSHLLLISDHYFILLLVLSPKTANQQRRLTLPKIFITTGFARGSCLRQFSWSKKSYRRYHEYNLSQPVLYPEILPYLVGFFLVIA